MGVRPYKLLDVVADGALTPDDLAGLAGPRPWLVRGYAMLGTVTALTGKGGFGKSTLALALAVCMALGQPFGWFEPIRRTKTLILNGEEDRAEMMRRLSAVCIALGIFDLSPLRGNLFILSDEDLRGKGIKLFERHGSDVAVRDTELAAAVPGLLDECEAEVLVIDPLVAAHESDENDNTQMELVMHLIRSMARKRHMSVITVHHDRKGTTDPTDAGRGASAIIDNVRLSLTLAMMTEAEHSELKPQGKREDFFRLVTGKANYTARENERWLHMGAVRIASIGPDGKHDYVGVPVPYEPSALRDFNPMTWERRSEFLAAVAQGEYLAARKGSSSRRLDDMVVQRFGLSKPDAWKLIDGFAAAHLIRVVSKKGSDRQTRDYYELVQGGGTSTSGGTESTASDVELPF